MKNLDLFSYKFNKIEEDDYIFDVKFGNQTGSFVINYNENNIIDEGSTLNIYGLDRPLGIYNDPSLRQVAEMLMNYYKSNKDENENN
ncbi:hypothetical protein [Clostridium ljungdahlii]